MSKLLGKGLALPLFAAEWAVVFLATLVTVYLADRTE